MKKDQKKLEGKKEIKFLSFYVFFMDEYSYVLEHDMYQPKIVVVRVDNGCNY